MMSIIFIFKISYACIASWSLHLSRLVYVIHGWKSVRQVFSYWDFNLQVHVSSAESSYHFQIIKYVNCQLIKDFDK